MRRAFQVKETLVLYALLAPALIFIAIFHYVPMYGVIIAFQHYYPGSNFLSLGPDTQWAGLTHFKTFLSSIFFWRLIRNTLTLSGLNLLTGFFVPIIFALLMNEIKVLKLKKVMQTASYLPYFISLVVVASMVLTLTSKDGLINKILSIVGVSPITVTTDSSVFPWVYVLTLIWKSFGWSSIIYMAALAGIDPSMYEAARIDGANRFQQMLRISIPAISTTIFILLIFSISGLLNANTEFILLLYSPATYERADVIGTYIYRIGIQGGEFSKTTAIGLFMQVISFSLLFFANSASRKINNFSVW